MTGPERYDVATPAREGGGAAPLAETEAWYADAELSASLDRIHEVLATVSGHGDDLDEDGHLDPGIVTALERLTGADDAPLEWASLHRRLEQRRLTWEQFWADPTAEPGGVLLFGEVIRAPLAEAALLREALPDLGEADAPR